MAKFIARILLLTAIGWSLFVSAETSNYPPTDYPPTDLQKNPVHVSTSTVVPWGGIIENGEKKGLLDRFAIELSKAARIPITNTSRPYPRVIYEVQTGQCDMAVMFSSPKAREIGISLGKVVSTQIILAGLKNSPPITSLDHLSGKFVGHIRGSKYGPVFDDNSQINKIPVLSMQQGINMLLRGRIEAMASADQTLYYTLSSMKLDSSTVKPLLTMHTATAELYFSRKSPNSHLIPYFKQALDQLQRNGTLNRLFYEEGYLPKDTDLSSSH